MPKSNNPVIQITSFEQVGMVVKDLTDSMNSMWNNFGIGPWDVRIYNPERIREAKYYGKPSKSGMKAAFCYVGKIQLELVEPIGEDNIFRDFEKLHGNGIQHLGWHIVKTEQDFFAITSKLNEAGHACIWSARSPRGRFAYFDTMKTLNTLLEVVWVDPEAAAVQPDYIYPA
ncbi:MAG: VOC family protein [Gammaproteobacteria bacterium]|nr:VOC family protein [Gammaproteobacteria bacterium]